MPGFGQAAHDAGAPFGRPEAGEGRHLAGLKVGFEFPEPVEQAALQTGDLGEALAGGVLHGEMDEDRDRSVARSDPGSLRYGLTRAGLLPMLPVLPYLPSRLRTGGGRLATAEMPGPVGNVRERGE